METKHKIYFAAWAFLFCAVVMFAGSTISYMENRGVTPTSITSQPLPDNGHGTTGPEAPAEDVRAQEEDHRKSFPNDRY